MNFRIIKIECGEVLVYRDTDDETQVMVWQYYDDQTGSIISQRMGFGFINAEGVKHIIAGLTAEVVYKAMWPLIEMSR